MGVGLLIVGAGQYAAFVKEIAVDLGYEKIGFVDDNSPLAIGTVDKIGALFGEYTHGVVAIGNPTVRKELTARLESCGYIVPALVHARAYVSPSASIGAGAIIEPNATVQSNAMVGKGSIVSSGAVVRHDGKVGDFCHCDCGSVVTSGATLEDGTKIDCGRVY